MVRAASGSQANQLVSRGGAAGGAVAKAGPPAGVGPRGRRPGELVARIFGPCTSRSLEIYPLASIFTRHLLNELHACHGHTFWYDTNLNVLSAFCPPPPSSRIPLPQGHIQEKVIMSQQYIYPYVIYQQIWLKYL